MTTGEKIREVVTGDHMITAIVDDPKDVERRCAEGFRLVEITHTDVVEETSRDVPYEDDSNYSNHKQVLYTSSVVRRPLFVMVQSGDTRVAQMTETILRLNKKVHELEESNESLQDDAKNLKNDLEYKKTALGSANDRLNRQDQDLETQRKRNRTLESDIGKLRVALGDLRMKEILGP